MKSGLQGRSHIQMCDRVYDIGEAQGELYLSMEYVDGEDLAALLRRIGKLPMDKAVEIALKLCTGLAAAHAKGMLHRDLKPANIMIDSAGEVRIMDFGLAAISEELRATQVAEGTPYYMAPEQLAGEKVSAQSDIYALGLVFYEMLTGKPPFTGNTPAELRRLREESRITPP
jgi:serine/threonine protein kinase